MPCSRPCSRHARGLLEALLFSGLIALLEPHFAIELLSLANTTLGVGLHSTDGYHLAHHLIIVVGRYNQTVNLGHKIIALCNGTVLDVL